MSLFARALRFASAAHDGQVRKGTAVPYVTHPVAVAALVAAYGGDEEQQAGALLHDVIEDCAPEYGAGIAERFGARVEAIVRACTDGVPDLNGRKPPWRERKEAYIAHLHTADLDAVLVSACDKLHNASCIVADLRAGVDVFARFVGGRGGTLWYYGALAGAVEDRLPDRPVTIALRREVTKMREAASGD